MIFTTDKESLLNKLRIVEKITVQRGIQPVLANILFETENNTLKLSATDLDISIITKTTAAVKEEGKITLPAKKIFEIVSKLPDKPVEFSLNPDNNVVTIKCGNSKFDVIGISAEEFPKIIKSESEIADSEAITIDTNPFTKSIKYTVYAAATYENRNIISGVFCKINEDTLEMAATDGNRLTRISEKIQNKNEKDAKIVIPSKTLNEFLRVSSIINEDKVSLIVSGSKIIFKTNSYILISKLLEGEYPQYQQLIPKTTATTVKVKKAELAGAIDRVACMINERTNVIKFILQNGKMYLKSETPDSGTSEDVIESDYQGDEFVIAFNYKFISDFIKIIDCENALIGINGNQSATVFRPDSEDDYICLVMPLKL
ncbi:MAG: DNA polymerase III subunit beta [Candidatus Gastranaerophilaceae bacterium]